MTVSCFMVEPVEEQEGWLRRYTSRDEPCPVEGRYGHSALTHIGRIPLAYDDDTFSVGRVIAQTDPEDFAGDERWPTRCACGYEFDKDDTWQVLGRQLWENADGERRILDAVHGDPAGLQAWGPGAMYDAWWLPEDGSWRGPDGLSLTVICPDGHPWHIDGRASNCTRPGEDHDCWCRHGVPPLITVDKNPEPGRSTCEAGGGSIATRGYHGFLRGGCFTGSV